MPRFPSDHLAVCHDLEWLPPGSSRPIAQAEQGDEEALQRHRSSAASDNVLRASLEPAVVRRAVRDLRADRVVALPTDTLYGVACCANSSKARPPRGLATALSLI